jgi:NADH-quinone oxidoreductase subunit J
MIETILFYVLALGVIGGAGQVILRRNPVHGALSLVACFFFLAGIYVLLSAHLIAILQILVYAGAVMVLFVFVIMLLNLRDEELGTPKRTAWKGIGLASVAISVGVIAWKGLGSAYASLDTPGSPALTDLAKHAVGRDPFGSLKFVAHAVYLNSVLPFELTSLLLLVAVLGAVVVAKGKI